MAKRGGKNKGGARRPPRKPKAPQNIDLSALPVGGEIDLSARKAPPPKARSKPPTRKEMDLRILSVEERLRDGLADSEVRNELMQRCTVGCHAGCTEHEEKRHIRGCPVDCRRHLGLSETSAKDLVRRAYERLRDLATPEEQGYRQQILGMLHRSYQGCIATGDYSGAANVVMKIARIRGLIDSDPNLTQVLALIQGLPSDKDRFAGDRNYQLLGMMRDALAQAGARGNVKAAAASAKIGADIVEMFGYTQGVSGSEAEREIAERVRARVITVSKFGDTPVERLERIDSHGRQLPAVNDFATEQAARKKRDPGG